MSQLVDISDSNTFRFLCIKVVKLECTVGPVLENLDKVATKSNSEAFSSIPKQVSLQPDYGTSIALFYQMNV